MEGDLMVCTLPLGVMQRIEFAPGLSGGKMRAVRQVTYDGGGRRDGFSLLGNMLR